MKKTLLFASILLSGAAMAQFTQANEPALSSTQVMYVCDSFVTDYAGTTGSGVTWDYSAIQGVAGATKTIEVLDPSATPEGASFASSTKAMAIPGFITSYMTSTASARNSQGFSFEEPTFGVVNLILDTDDELLMNYPYALGNNLVDAVAGTASATLGDFPCSGAVQTAVDGQGTLRLNATTQFTNVLRYKIHDSLYVDAGFLGIITMVRDQYEYYDLANNSMPLFIHTNLVINLGGTPQALRLVLSSVQPDTFLAISSEELTGVTVYPNPAKDVLNINGLTETATISITDMQGKVVRNLDAQAGTSSVSINDLNAGMYVINVQTASGMKTQRLVVE